MFVLRTVCFIVVSHAVFHPICGETKQNATESSVNATEKAEGKVADGKLKIPLPEITFEGGPMKAENNLTTAPSATTQAAIVKPVTEKEAVGKHGREGELENTLIRLDNVTETNATSAHVTVPKKGVSLNDTIVKPENITSTTEKLTTEKSTTVYVKPKKPTVTVGSNAESQIDQKNKNSSTEKVPTIEYYQQNKEQIRKADFVIPIIAVILSVPIVAIVMNILYKRGKEWWSHRHYRRMDFLIDGMYNN